MLHKNYTKRTITSQVRNNFRDESLISIVHNHTKDGGVPHYSTNAAGGAPATTTTAWPAALSTTVQLYV